MSDPGLKEITALKFKRLNIITFGPQNFLKYEFVYLILYLYITQNSQVIYISFTQPGILAAQKRRYKDQ